VWISLFLPMTGGFTGKFVITVWDLLLISSGIRNIDDMTHYRGIGTVLQSFLATKYLW
jgi:hypothetical protein